MASCRWHAAPASSRARATSAWPTPAASCSGVCPLELARFTRAPAARSFRTIPTYPFQDARWRAVVPSYAQKISAQLSHIRLRHVAGSLPPVAGYPFHAIRRLCPAPVNVFFPTLNIQDYTLHAAGYPFHAIRTLCPAPVPNLQTLNIQDYTLHAVKAPAGTRILPPSLQVYG